MWAIGSDVSRPIPHRGADWFPWARRVRVDVGGARADEAAVHAATDTIPGTGVGLDSARWIVQRRGTLGVRSRLGAGSTFVVRPPVQPGR